MLTYLPTLFRSKALFLAYLDSGPVKNVIGEIGVGSVKDFARRNVFPHEQRYCFYLRKHVRSYDVYTNTIHEGTNNSIKTGEHAVLPQHVVDKSAKIMADRDATKYAENQKMTARHVHSRVLWTESQTADKLTVTGDSLRAEQDSQVDMYSSMQVGPRKFLVLRSVHYGSRRNNTCSLFPRFQRIHVVVIQDDGTLLCDCNYFESMGIPCRHCGHVCKYHNMRPGFEGFTYLDTSVVWWRSYQHYAHKPFSELFTEYEHQLQATLRKLFVDDIKGPRVDTLNMRATVHFPCNYMVGSESSEKFWKAISIAEAKEFFTFKPTIEGVLNYSVTEVKSALLKKANCVAFALSQDVWHGEYSQQQDSSFNLCDDDDGLQLPFDGNNRAAEAHAAGIESCTRTPGSSAYQELNPIFKEIVQCLDANSSQVHEVKSQLNGILHQVKQNLASISSIQSAPEGRFVSSSIPRAKRRKVMITKRKYK
jgi:hypothetical protein